MSSNDREIRADSGDSEPIAENDSEDFILPEIHESRVKWLHRKMTRSSAEKLLDARGSYLIRESHCCTTPAAGAVADPSVLSPVGSPGESSPNSSRHTKLPASGESADQTADTNSYVLSYKSQSDEFCHFKILQSCGQFFIGGKKFQSLEHLVNFYKVKECIIPNEYLIHPVATKLPQAIPQKRKMIAKYNYNKVPDTDELSLKLGEILTVENDSGSGWFWLKSEASLKSGWVHDLLVSPYVACLEELKTKEYFAVCDKEESMKLLRKGDPGSFLIREATRNSSSDPIALTLCVRTRDNIHRFKIEVKSEIISTGSPNGSSTSPENSPAAGANEDEECMNESFDSANTRVADVYWMGGRKYTSVDQMVTRYQAEEILDNLCLTNPPKPLIEMKAASQLNDEQQSRNGLANGQRSSWELDDEDVQTVLRSRMSTRSQDASDLVGNYESVLKKGFLDKCKTGSVKKWKKCYFVLNARNQVLYLFEDNTTRKKPKDLIDMTSSQVYPIDSSLSDRNFAFQIVTRFNSDPQPRILYLAAISAQERQEWMSSLMMCQGSFPFSSSVGQLLEQKSVEKLMEAKSRECQNLYLEIKEVLDLASPKVYSFMPPAHNLFVLIQLDDIPYAKTCSLDEMKSQCTFQKFCFKKLPSELKTIRMALMSSKSKKGNQDLGFGVINLQLLPKNVLHCAKYGLCPVMKNMPLGNPCGYSSSSTLPPSHLGTVRCEVFLKHFTILPEQMYAKLQTCLLSQEGPDLLYQLGYCLPVRERNFYALSLLKTYLHLRSETDFIVKLNAIEIAKEDEQTLFRSTSLAVSVMEHYLSKVMQPFVQQALQPIIDLIVFDPDVTAGVPIASPNNNQDPERWSRAAKRYLQHLADNILGQVDMVPTNLRYILQQIKREVEQKWPVRPMNGEQLSASHPGVEWNRGGAGSEGAAKNQMLRYRMIASFFFLRCISLALCTPRKYNLIIGSPPNIAAAQEMLKLLAKLLQSWANFTQLKDHAGFDVHSLNNYLRQNQERMEGFLEGVSTSPQGPNQSSPADSKAQCDLAEKFASLHRLCCDNHATLKKFSFEKPSLKKLLFIIEEIAEKSGHTLGDS